MGVLTNHTRFAARSPAAAATSAALRRAATPRHHAELGLQPQVLLLRRECSSSGRGGAVPNARNYTVVIAHLASAGFVDQALEVWEFFCWAVQEGGDGVGVLLLGGVPPRQVRARPPHGGEDGGHPRPRRPHRAGGAPARQGAVGQHPPPLRHRAAGHRLLRPLQEGDAAARVFQDAESICGPVSRPNLALLCSLLLKTMAKSRRGPDAMELLEEMMARGVPPDLQTSSGLMEHLAGAGDLRGVQRLLGLVRQCELRLDGYMYIVLMRAYCKRERAALALRVFDEMRAAGMVPDAPTKALLVKSLWWEGKLREAALVEERCEVVAGGLPE